MKKQGVLYVLAHFNFFFLVGFFGTCSVLVVCCYAFGRRFCFDFIKGMIGFSVNFCLVLAKVRIAVRKKTDWSRIFSPVFPLLCFLFLVGVMSVNRG